jgi:hypothetical protein
MAQARPEGSKGISIPFWDDSRPYQPSRLTLQPTRDLETLLNLYKHGNFFNMVLISYSITIYKHYIEQVRECDRRAK